jgi:hypothetical protein
MQYLHQVDGRRRVHGGLAVVDNLTSLRHAKSASLAVGNGKQLIADVAVKSALTAKHTRNFRSTPVKISSCFFCLLIGSLGQASLPGEVHDVHIVAISLLPLFHVDEENGAEAILFGAEVLGRLSDWLLKNNARIQSSNKSKCLN